MKDTILCDIDGTIANIGHRVHYLEEKPKNWDAFYEACSEDTPYEDVVQLVQTLSEKCRIIYLSGRRESTREKTLTWLHDNGLPPGDLFMRGDRDFREDTTVKKEILTNFINKKYIWFVLDDRDSVVKMWREEGLTCLQVKEGDY